VLQGVNTLQKKEKHIAEVISKKIIIGGNTKLAYFAGVKSY
jgi:hypothetical protein